MSHKKKKPRHVADNLGSTTPELNPVDPLTITQPATPEWTAPLSAEGMKRADALATVWETAAGELDKDLIAGLVAEGTAAPSALHIATLARALTGLQAQFQHYLGAARQVVAYIRTRQLTPKEVQTAFTKAGFVAQRISEFKRLAFTSPKLADEFLSGQTTFKAALKQARADGSVKKRKKKRKPVSPDLIHPLVSRSKLTATHFTTEEGTFARVELVFPIDEPLALLEPLFWETEDFPGAGPIIVTIKRR